MARTGPHYDGKMEQSDLLKVVKSSECILCGICQADDPVKEGDPRAQLNPAAAVKAIAMLSTRGRWGRSGKAGARPRLLDRPLEAAGKMGCPKEIDLRARSSLS